MSVSSNDDHPAPSITSILDSPSSKKGDLQNPNGQNCIDDDPLGAEIRKRIQELIEDPTIGDEKKLEIALKITQLIEDSAISSDTLGGREEPAVFKLSDDGSYR